MSADIVQALPLWWLKKHKAGEEERLHFEKLAELKKNIEICKEDLNLARQNFDNVTELRLIDFYIYKIQSEQSRYAQLLEEYKAEERAFVPSEAT